jgi:hypothetical protein
MEDAGSSTSNGIPKAMEFTEKGLQLVKTLEFARMVDDYFLPWREQRFSESDLTRLLVAIVAWAATGQAVGKPPTGRQSYELTAFTISHLEEIENLSSDVLEKIVGLRTPH